MGAFSAVIQAGMDGIKNQIHPGDPCDINLYEASAEELAKLGIKGVPSTLKEAINALEKDNDFLLAGGVSLKTFLKNGLLKRMMSGLDTSNVQLLMSTLTTSTVNQSPEIYLSFLEAIEVPKGNLKKKRPENASVWEYHEKFGVPLPGE